MRKLFTAILLLNCSALFCQEWTLMTPLRTASDVRGCSFLDEMNGYIVATTEGNVLRTNDGGMSWKRLWTGSSSGNFYDVFAASTDTIFVCGSNGLLYRSVDGGNSWIDTNPPTNEYLYSIYFLNTEIGFACGFNGVMLRTDNGGDSWSVISTGTTNRLWDITFVNDTLGYACGWFGTVLKTTDAGLTWNLNVIPGDASFQGISFVDELTGYVSGSAQTIMKTTDGGQNWVTQITGGTQTLNYICFRNASVGWAFGTYGTYYTTTNGGSSWTLQPVLGIGAHFYCGQYLSSSSSFVMGTQQIFKSANNGSSWTLVKNGVPRAKYNALWFADNNTGYAAGSTGVVGEGSNQSGIIKTTSAGQTWDIQQQGSSGGWYGMHFPSANTGYVIGGGSMAKTTNAGDSWLSLNNSPELTGKAVWFLDNNTGFAGGDGLFSNICKTTNGGSSFECGNNLVAGDFYFVNENLGFAIMNSMTTTIFRTTDGGETWEYLDSGIYYKTSIHFLNENEGWVGSMGTVIRTTDGGDNWESFEMPNSGSPIVAIHFYSSELGFCVSQSGTLHKTSDGGETWEIIVGNFVNMPTTLNAWFTEDYVFIGCMQGDIYRAELGCGEFTAGNIFGSSFWCENEGGNLLAETIPGATYEWTYPADWTATQSGAFLSVIAGETSGLISVEITNACGLTSSASHSVTVMPNVAELASILGNPVICGDATAVYSIPEDVNAEEYEWQWSSQLQATEQGNELIVTSATGNGYISVHSENECGSSNTIGLSISVSSGGMQGDLTNDCLVDIDDVNQLLSLYGCTFNCGDADLDGDGVVGMGDVMMLVALIE